MLRCPAAPGVLLVTVLPFVSDDAQPFRRGSRRSDQFEIAGLRCKPAPPPASQGRDHQPLASMNSFTFFATSAEPESLMWISS